jgi:hypothetical protein
VAQDKIEAASDVRTDGWRWYESVIVRKDLEALKQLRWVHVLTVNVKGNLRGIYHGVSEKHLDRYLAEFSYWLNRCFWYSQLFNRTITACLSPSTVTFAESRA